MTTKFNIGDTVIYHHKNGICGKFKIDSIHITDKGIVYGGENGIYNGIKEDDLTKAPVTREEALATALKEVGRRISRKIDVELSEVDGHFEVWSKTHNGPYIGGSKDDYSYEEE